MEAGSLQRSEPLFGVGTPAMEPAAALETAGMVAGVDIGEIGDRILPKPDDLKSSESSLKTQTLTGRGRKVLRVGNLLAGAAGAAFGALLVLGLASNPIGWGVALSVLLVGLSMAGITGGKKGVAEAFMRALGGFAAGAGAAFFGGGLAAWTPDMWDPAMHLFVGIVGTLISVVVGCACLGVPSKLQLMSNRIAQVARPDGGIPTDKQGYKRVVSQLGDTSNRFVMVSDAGQLQTVSKARYNLEKVQAQLRTFSGIDEAVVDHQILKLLIKGFREDSAQWLDSSDIQKLTNRLTGDLRNRIRPILDSQTQATDKVEALEAVLLEHYTNDLQQTVEAQVAMPTFALGEFPVDESYRLKEDLFDQRIAVRDELILRTLRYNAVLLTPTDQTLLDRLSDRARNYHDPDRYRGDVEKTQNEMQRQRNIAKTYMDAGDAATNPPTKVFYYALGAKLGHPECIAKLGDCYRDGTGVKKDLPLALGFYAKLRNTPEIQNRYLKIISEEQNPSNLQLLADKSRERNSPYTEFQALAALCASKDPSFPRPKGDEKFFHMIDIVENLKKLTEDLILGDTASRALVAATQVARQYLGSREHIRYGSALLKAIKPDEPSKIYDEVLLEAWKQRDDFLLAEHFIMLRDKQGQEKRAFWCMVDSMCLKEGHFRFDRADIKEAYDWISVRLSPSHEDLRLELRNLAGFPPVEDA